jgi:hypothetical protein
LPNSQPDSLNAIVQEFDTRLFKRGANGCDPGNGAATTGRTDQAAEPLEFTDHEPGSAAHSPKPLSRPPKEPASFAALIRRYRRHLPKQSSIARSRSSGAAKIDLSQ